MFYDYGIKYKYECPLTFRDGTVFYPDFTFLSPHTLEEIYWEHHGMMDNPQYALNTVRKIEKYENNGILRNQRLIITYECSNHNLNYNWVQLLIKEFLIKDNQE